MRRVLAVFDGHNDTLTRDDADRFATGRDGGDIDLPRARAGGLAGGIFACFTATPDAEEIHRDVSGGGYFVELPDPIGEDVAAPHAARTFAHMHRLEREGHIRIVREIGDLDRARADGVLAAVEHLEGAEAIDPELETLEFWHAAGLRSIGPVWSRANAFAHGVPFAYPSTGDHGPGLTPAGKALVGKCADLGIAIDLSHLNEAGFWDVAKLDRAPLIASHSAAYALCPASRNLTDEQLDAIGASGGLVGIVYAVGFIREDGAEEADTPLSVIAAHARYVADRIGPEHVALGSDFDGAKMPAALGDVAGLPKLIDELRAAGFTDSELEAIAWGNWRRVLAAAWVG